MLSKIRNISIFKSKCIFSTRPLVSRCVLHNDLQSNASYTNFKRDRDKNNTLGGFKCAKNHFTFPQMGAYYFLQCLKEYFHLWRHFEVSSLLLFSVVSGSDNAMTNFSDRHRSHLRLPPLYGYALL